MVQILLLKEKKIQLTEVKSKVFFFFKVLQIKLCFYLKVLQVVCNMGFIFGEKYCLKNKYVLYYLYYIVESTLSRVL